MNTVQNGKGRGPEKGRDLEKFRDNYDQIDWGRSFQIQTMCQANSTDDSKNENSPITLRDGPKAY